MVTKRELIEALADISDDDEVIVALRTPPEDDDGGFSETETPAAKPEGEDSDPPYIEIGINALEVVDSEEDTSKKALLLHVDMDDEDDDEDEDDTIYVNDEGYYVDKDDNYITKEGEPSDTPVKADPEDMPNKDD